MEDTQRSQPISTDNQKIAKGAVRDSSKMDTALWQEDLPPVLIGQSSLARIRELAISEPEMVFTSLVHRIDLYLLK